MTTARWQIRPAAPSDRPALSEIYLSTRRSTFTWLDPTRFSLEDFSSQSKGERVFVCTDDHDEIAGFMSILEQDSFIHMLYIRANLQGSGAGAALLKALPGWPERRYRLKCLIKNKRARGFYERMGFVVTGIGTSTEGNYHDMMLRPPEDRAR